MKRLSEVAELVGLLRQRIQEYEKAGIALKPKVKDKHGYWLYGEAEIERLWQIKFYLTLGLTVPKIKTIFADPNYNKHNAIADQIAKLEKQKKSLESMIEIARAYNEMDVLPSDLYRQGGSVLESAPYEATVPLIGKFISLLSAEADDEFWDDLCDNFSSEQDEEKWAEAVGAIISYYQKGISYKEDSVQRQAGIVYNVTAKAIPDSFIKQLWRCQKILEDAVDSNDKSIKEAFGEDCLEYINDAVQYYYIDFFAKNPDELHNLPAAKILCSIEQLGKNRFTTGSVEVQSEVESLHKLLADFGIFSKAAQLELLDSLSSSMGCESSRKVFDGGRERGIFWFISRAIQIYCDHQREMMEREEGNDE